jgi:hypothetical protein
VVKDRSLTLAIVALAHGTPNTHGVAERVLVHDRVDLGARVLGKLDVLAAALEAVRCHE